jgi:hypothetical protein
VDNSRPQDQGRAHRRARKPTAADASLLAEWQDAMRTELRAVIVELRGTVEPTGLLPGVEPIVKRPSLADRARYVDLGVKLSTALGTAVDLAPGPTSIVVGPGKGPKRGRVDFG